MDLVVIIVMGAVILYQGITNYLEKQRHDKKEDDLLNRVMSRDYTDYTTNQVYTTNANRKQEPTLEEMADRYIKMEEQGIPVTS